MNNLLVTFMDHRLDDLTHLLLIDDGLMMFMNDWLMMLMNDIFVMLMNHILMVLMNDISMSLFNDWGCRMRLNPGGHSV